MRCPHCRQGIIHERSTDFLTHEGLIPLLGCYLCGYLAIMPYMMIKEEAEPCETATE